MARERNEGEGKAGMDALARLLIELNLTTLARELPQLLAQAEGDAPGYSQFLRQALERECRVRAERRVERHLRWSRLGVGEGLEGFNWGARPQLAAQAIRELATCRFVDERRNLVFVGRSSLGKTRIAKAIGDAACRKGHSVYYTTLGEMLETLRAARADGTYKKALRRVIQCALLIVDDAGLEPLSIEAGTELFRVVCGRYGTRSTVMLANLPLKRWGDFLPCPAQAVATIDRLIHNATILRFSGEPFRRPREVLGTEPEGDE